MASCENKPPKGDAGSHLRAALRRAPAGTLAALLTMSAASHSRAQSEEIYRPRTSAYLPYGAAEPVKYNLKFGKLSARLSGGITAEFSDNINLSETDARADFSIGPTLGVGLLYPLSKDNVLQFDLGVSYRWYVNSPAINSISIAPNSHFDHTVIIGDVRLNFHDNFTVQVDPLLRTEIAGTPGKQVNFRRFHNTLGVSAEWQPVRKWTFVAGYDYGLDRTLSADFGSLDYDSHTFSAGAQYLISPKWSAGLQGSYTLTDYVRDIQNDGDSYTIGPNVTWKPTKYITVTASAGYSVSRYEANGTIADRSEFSGFTYEVGVRHQLNRRTSHDVQFGYRIGEGLGSNYTETHRVQYNLRRQITSAVTLGGSFAYETSLASGIGGEGADRYLFNLGTSFQLSRRWLMGLSYSFAWRDSDQIDRSYSQNRVTLNLTREF